MRLPNLSVSDSITNTIRSLDLQRYKLDQQISSGQKITLPEDDGMRLGRVINLDTEKANLHSTKGTLLTHLSSLMPVISISII